MVTRIGWSDLSSLLYCLWKCLFILPTAFSDEFSLSKLSLGAIIYFYSQYMSKKINIFELHLSGKTFF